MSIGQPPITLGHGIVSSDWLPGPHDGADSPVVVSFTDFLVQSDRDLHEVFKTGLRLAESWPIMQGAVGTWLWGKPEKHRGGALSVWRTTDDLQRFVRWPVHTAIIKEWRNRVEVLSELWHDDRFDAAGAWLRAEQLMRAGREPSPPETQPSALTAPQVRSTE